MNILFLSRWYPYPVDNGAKIRIYNLIKHLSSQHHIDLISFTSAPLREEQILMMRRFCRRLSTVVYQPFKPSGLKATAGYFSSKPRSIIDTYNFDLQQMVRKAADENGYNLVIASEIDMAPYAAKLEGVPKIFEEVELTALIDQYIQQQNPLRRVRAKLMLWKTRNYFNRELSNFDGFTVVSEQEKRNLNHLMVVSKPIGVIPNGVNISEYSDYDGNPEPDTLIYAGALTYHANYDAVAYFLKDIYPLIKAKRPKAKFYITGKTEGVAIEQLPNQEDVVYTGYLGDVRKLLAHTWVSIVPLRIGGGTRMKILESLAIGTPVVTTSKGAEGLEVIPGRDVLVADEPVQFADAILQVLQDPNLRESLKNNGLNIVKTRYDWKLIGQRLDDFINTVIE